MSGTTGKIPLQDWIDDQLITKETLNAENANIASLMDANGCGGHSDTDADAQLQTNPYPGSVLSKATSIAGEFERIRYVLAQILGKPYWFQPAASGNNLSSVFISGEIKPFAGASAPAGFLSCDGSAISRTTYADLFSAIGTAWGVGDGSTTFNIPDLRGRSLYGKDGGALFTSIGSKGGTQSHTHNVTVPSSSHSHTVNPHGHSISHKHTVPVGQVGATVYQIDANGGWGQGVESIAMTAAYQNGAVPFGPQSINFQKTKDSDVANSGNTSPGTDSQTIAAQTPTSTGANPPYATVLYIIKT